MRTIVLIACCGKKLSGAHSAKDLYQSALFKKSRAWAEQNGDAWMILSAKHGVVRPDDEIAAYDMTLNNVPWEYHMEWASRVACQLKPYADDRLVILAGKRYCKGWISRFATVERPMEGLGIGQQLAWLTRQITTPNMDFIGASRSVQATGEGGCPASAATEC